MTKNKSQPGFILNSKVLFFGTVFLGLIGTIFFSNGAKPGSIFYPVDLSVEDFLLNRAVDPLSETELHIKFASERVDEIQRILQDKNIDYQALDLALGNLITHKIMIVQLIVQEEGLKAYANDLDESFSELGGKLDMAFVTAETNKTEEQIKSLEDKRTTVNELLNIQEKILKSHLGAEENVTENQ